MYKVITIKTYKRSTATPRIFIPSLFLKRLKWSKNDNLDVSIIKNELCVIVLLSKNLEIDDIYKTKILKRKEYKNHFVKLHKNLTINKNSYKPCSYVISTNQETNEFTLGINIPIELTASEY